MGDLAGVDLATAPVGIDGCGLPTYGLPLQRPRPHVRGGLRRTRRSGAARTPWPATRTSWPDADASTPPSSRPPGAAITAKGGAAGVWVAVRRPAGPALAIKLEAGDQSAVLGGGPRGAGSAGLARRRAELATPALAGFAATAVRNWAGHGGRRRSRPSRAGSASWPADGPPAAPRRPAERPGTVAPPGAIVAEEMLTPMSILGRLDALTATVHGQRVTLDDSCGEGPHA